MAFALLDCQSLCKSFGGIRAVDNVSFAVESNKITAIIGPNGAGKTTLFNLITGFLKADRGKILFNNIGITDLPPFQIARKGIARNFQELRFLHQVSVLENVLLARQHQAGENALHAILNWRVAIEEKGNCAAATRILEYVGLGSHSMDLAGNLSYGQQKLLTLACSLSMDANFLLLDEPVSGVHENMIDKILLLLRDLVKGGMTICFIEHNVEAVRQVADTVIVMDEGKIITSGNPAEILENPEVVEIYLD
jgi:ABC-type branched-subunit amino acid transport system ATPase component